MNEDGVTKVPFVDLAAQFSHIEAEVLEAITGVLERGDFILGESVDRFEHEMAEYCEAAHAVGVDSGTSALELALRACDIGPGDEVITVANTFIATVLAISHSGATPVLVDIDRDTYGIDVSQIESAISPSTRAIIPVHLYGHPVDMDPVLEIARDHQLTVIEDASQAHGARYKGKRVGALGDLGIFSLYPAKNLGAYGDAGVIVTNESSIAERLRLMRNYGSTSKYVHEFRGYNRRLDTIQASVLRVKLEYLDKWNQMRRDHAAYYIEALAALGSKVTPPRTAGYAEPVFHLFVVSVEDRDGLQRHLADRGISTLVHYPIPVHLQEAYEDLGLGPGSFPEAEDSANHIVSLPMYPELDRATIDKVVEAISDFVRP